MKKVFIYPILSIFICSLVIFMLLASLRKIGQETAYPESSSLFSQNQVLVYNVWERPEAFKLEKFKGHSVSGLQVIKNPGPFLSFASQKGEVEGRDLLLVLRFRADREKLLSFLKELSILAPKRILVASPYHNTLSNLRKIEPRFFYAAHIKEVLKWRLYSTLYIETFFDLNADFIFLDENLNQSLDDKIKKEIKRRAYFVYRLSAEEKIK